MMELLLYLYILIVVYLFFKYSRIRTLYIFSPYILIYLNFIFNDAIPFLFFYPDASREYSVYDIYSSNYKPFVSISISKAGTSPNINKSSIVVY